MALHTMPESLPANWLASKKLPSADGMYESWIVLHPSNSSYHPFVIHKGYFIDEGEYKGKFEYQHGEYCATIEEAHKAFKERCK
jgi:hypothetical protein